MKKKWTTAPGFHQDLWVMFALGGAALAWNAWFIGWSLEGQALARGLLAVYVLLGGVGAAGFCAVTEDPARRRRKRRGLRGGRDCRILRGNL